MKPKAPLRQTVITVGLLLFIVIVALTLIGGAAKTGLVDGEVLPATPIPAQIVPIYSIQGQ